MSGTDAPLLTFETGVRRALAARCQAFARLAPSEATRGLKHAAVALTLVNHGGDLAFLLTRRAARLNAHAGQWALPGGRCDPGETAVAAALRELREELGLTATPEQTLGVLDDYPTRSGYLITPVLVWLEETRTLAPNPLEVAAVHAIAFRTIAGREAVSFETIPESPRPVLRLTMMGAPVHAPTAALLYQARELLLGRVTRVRDFEQPVFAWG